jgi:hypothetical protein
MIEPRIFDQNDEHLDVSEPFKTHLLHPPVLRINTNTISDTKHVLRVGNNQLDKKLFDSLRFHCQERANTTVATKDSISPDISANVY